MAIEIVSLHFPKAGGTSLRTTLEQAFGAAAVLRDYGDDPANPCSACNLDPVGFLQRARSQSAPEGVRVVHGHFPLVKHLHWPGARRIVFLRHPVELMISLYFFWQTTRTGHCLSQYFRANRLGLVETAQLPALRYLLSRTYLRGASVHDFHFIGVMDHYAEDVRHLARWLGLPLREAMANQNTYESYAGKVQRVRADRVLMERLHDLLAEDIAVYNEAVALRHRILDTLTTRPPEAAPKPWVLAP